MVQTNIESVRERDTNRIAVGKPSVGMASPESGNPSGNLRTGLLFRET